MSPAVAARATREPSFSVVIPAYNEAANLPVVLPEVIRVLRDLSSAVEVIVVDDGSRDGTERAMRELCGAWPELVYLQLSRNFGKEAALTAGIDAARGELVLLIDADGQHPVAMIPAMVERWRAGADVVYAVRSTRNDQTLLHARLASLFYLLVNWRNRVAIPPGAGDFRLMDRRVVDALKALPERNRFMKGLYAWVGFVSTTLEYDPLPRHQGKSRFGLRSALSLGLTGLVSFSPAPLRLFAYLGLAISSLSLAYGLWVVLQFVAWGNDVPGWPTIVAGIMFLSGIQLLSVGVLSEYVGRIYEEVKQRPVYLLRDRAGSGLPDEAP